MSSHHFAPRGRLHRAPYAGTLATLAALLAVAACQSTPSADSSEGPGKSLPGVKEFGLTEVQFVEHIEQTQALIADCMAEAGFEYIPVDVKSIEAAQARVRSDPGYTRRSYKEKWGLGVTTRFDSPVRDTGLGPNLEIWQGLPEADQEAYSRTLWGDNPKYDFVFAFDEEDFSETGGCTREAVAQVFTRAQLKGTYVNPKDVLVENDPRIIEAEDKWTECMRSAGYDYEDDQDEIIEDYEQRLEELLGEDDPQSLTGHRQEQLRKLQQEEIAVSLVDLDCQIKHTDDVFRQVEIEVFGQPVSG
ncbi:MAG TPA: hypothetical protein VFY11_00350 [Nocardioidaceae bacterium]|nr:hypothetical protein [Nocardioidaceae bacterium]